MRTVGRSLGAIHRATRQDFRAHVLVIVLDTNVLCAQFGRVMAANGCACHVFDTNVLSAAGAILRFVPTL